MEEMEVLNQILGPNAEPRLEQQEYVKVIPARLFGTRKDTGGKVEILLVAEKQPGEWRALGRPLKKLKVGTALLFDGGIEGVVKERLNNQEVLLAFNVNNGASFNEALASVGTMPIPPYIRNGLGDTNDRLDYQSLFARFDGSVAAPTASLHFTESLLNSLADRGIETCTVTLHVGPASFLPVFKPEDEAVQAPGAESFVFPEDTWELIAKAKQAGRRIIAVGTTMVRALESIAREYKGETTLFITPGFEFKVCSGVITNFHQPGTTHLLLVQAFIGERLLTTSYEYALQNDFRFLSYGDGMLLL